MQYAPTERVGTRSAMLRAGGSPPLQNKSPPTPAIRYHFFYKYRAVTKCDSTSIVFLITMRV